MLTSPAVVPASRRAARARRIGALTVGLTASLLALLGAEPAPAQTVNTNVSTGTAISISVEPPTGSTADKLGMGNIRVFFTITNNGPALANQQVVLRVGRKPDEIASVSEGSDLRGIGLIDSASGAWYHTIPQIPANGSVTLVLSMIKVCGGKWPIAARVGDKLASQVATWKATSDARCGLDETASPAPASYYQLAWPPAAASSTATTVAATISTTVSTAVSTGSTLPGATGTTLLRLGGPNATTTSTSTTTTSTIAGKAGVTTTTVILCKTIGGKRYCAPKSSVYKDGQTKSVEVSTKTTKKKASKTTKKR